ncbi:hypothetical protein NT6N_27420 [Oceaniferula spumae]|uniref:M6 family metalloprotease domain-containing protein n=1 Tax=Oceaniferula spumae TaxID=2979115 RepID=A0AAT9FNK2_9BACT
MKRFILVFWLGFLGWTFGATYGPKGKAVEFEQPNGVILKLRVFGDEFYARTETVDGKTVVYSETTGAYHYAVLRDGDFVARDQVGALGAVVPKETAVLSKAVRQAKWEAGRKALGVADAVEMARRRAAVKAAMKALPAQKRALDADVDAAPSQALISATSYKGLAILIQFPEDVANSQDAVSFPMARDKVVRFCNELGYNDDGNTDSVRGYYKDQSNNLVDYTHEVTAIVTLPNARNYYNFLDYPTNTIVRSVRNAGSLMLNDALDILEDDNFDFSTLTLDENDRILSTNMLFAGNTSGVFSQGLWPSRTSLLATRNVGTAGSPRRVSGYQMTNIADDSESIGTYVHESAHLLFGMPDLYDLDQGAGESSSGLGQHCLMSGGNFSDFGRTPSPINAYLKETVGWLEYEEVGVLDSKVVSLTTTGNKAVRVRNEANVDEFFVIENRGSGDRWAQWAPAKGILVWHVDEAKFNNREEQRTEAQHYWVSLEQADGLFELEGDGAADSDDAFVNGGEFSGSTVPSAHWWNGTDSGLRMRVASDQGTSMDVVFGLPGDVEVLGPLSGRLIRGYDVEIRWLGRFDGLVDIELLDEGMRLMDVVKGTENDGSFVWSVPSDLAVRGGYYFRVVSVQDGAIYDSGSEFEVGDELFATGGVAPADFNSTADSDADWVVVSDEAQEGDFSMRAGNVGNSQKSVLRVTRVFGDGEIVFYLKVSSEENWDGIRFYIDGVRQDVVVDGPRVEFSGERDWTEFRYAVTAGSHELRWEYDKDGGVDNGSDTAWMDGFRFEAAEAASSGETFPNGGNFPDSWASSGDMPWVMTDAEMQSGTHSFASGTIGDSETSTMEVSGDSETSTMEVSGEFKAGVISFYAKASCEEGYDLLKFYGWGGATLESGWDYFGIFRRKGLDAV